MIGSEWWLSQRETHPELMMTQYLQWHSRQMSRMARPRDLDFSTSVNNADERRDRRKRAGVLFSETSENIAKDDYDNGKEVIIVVRDKKSLSLALRRLQCCSTCFSDSGSGRCKCEDRRQDSTVSVISSGSLNCNKCQKYKVRLHDFPQDVHTHR